MKIEDCVPGLRVMYHGASSERRTGTVRSVHKGFIRVRLDDATQTETTLAYWFEPL